MTSGRPEVAVGILNYETRDLLIENVGGCLRSGLSADQLLVWDNRSSDGSVAAVRERFPDVRCVASERNLGYAEGMNRIVEALDARWVVLVTADCFVTSGTIRDFVRVFQSEADVALAGCRIIDGRTRRIQSDGGDITYPTGVALARHWQQVPDPSARGTVSDVSYLDGAVLAVDRRVFLELGGFDASYFAYQEDVDLCWRSRLRGYRVVCVESTSAFHVTSASFRRAPMLHWTLSERNRMASNLKNLEAPHLAVALIYEGLYATAVTLGAGRLQRPGYRRAYWQGLLALLRGGTGILSERSKVQRLRTRRDREVLSCHPKMGLLALAKALSQRAALARQTGS